MKECVQGHTANKWQSQKPQLQAHALNYPLAAHKVDFESLFIMKNYYNQFPDSLLNWKKDMFDHISKISVRSSILLPLTLLPICGNLCIPCGYGRY